MELNCTDVVQVASQSEQTLLGLVVPHLHLVVVAATHEEGLSFVEVDAADGPYTNNNCYYPSSLAIF